MGRLVFFGVVVTFIIAVVFFLFLRDENKPYDESRQLDYQVDKSEPTVPVNSAAFETEQLLRQREKSLSQEGILVESLKKQKEQKGKKKAVKVIKGEEGIPDDSPPPDIKKPLK